MTPGDVRPLRIGCVPYLNAKPLIEWFHDPACDVVAEIVYAVPSRLAVMLETDEVDAALVSTFELFQNPSLVVLPDLSISADGPVKSVRLFSQRPWTEIRTVALDTSSLTSNALIRVLLADIYDLRPEYQRHDPLLDEMLAACDAGLIIGDLQLFDTPARHILDLGAAWKSLTGLPFCYAAWLARPDAPIAALSAALTRARDWGAERLEALTVKWSANLGLPIEQVRDYFFSVMRYSLGEGEQAGLREFQRRCASHGLIQNPQPILVGVS